MRILITRFQQPNGWGEGKYGFQGLSPCVPCYHLLFMGQWVISLTCWISVFHLQDEHHNSSYED